MFAAVTAFASEQAWTEWQQLPTAAKIAESELRTIVAIRIERDALSDGDQNADAELSRAFDRWNAAVQQVRLENSRTALISQIVEKVQHLG